MCGLGNADCVAAMSTLISRFLDDAYLSFLGSPVNCCMRDEAPTRGWYSVLRLEFKGLTIL